jgi:hypothetical protein
MSHEMNLKKWSYDDFPISPLPFSPFGRWRWWEDAHRSVKIRPIGVIRVPRCDGVARSGLEFIPFPFPHPSDP